LYDLQNGRCFYTERPLRNDFEVDHFFPWARLHNNGIENLVLTNKNTNINKSDHLVGTELLAKWTAHERAHSSDLNEIAQRKMWERHPHKSIGILRSVYLRLSSGTKLWTGPNKFEEADPSNLLQALTK